MNALGSPAPRANTGPPTAAQLECNGALLRVAISRTLDELSARLTTQHLRDVVTEDLRHRASRLGSQMTGAIRHRPKSATAIGVATGLICGVLLRQRHRSGKS